MFDQYKKTKIAIPKKMSFFVDLFIQLWTIQDSVTDDFLLEIPSTPPRPVGLRLSHPVHKTSFCGRYRIRTCDPLHVMQVL
ncbi:MAG: hypothetical protein QG633_53 [Patescibacteria group bacterium]|nr:hypothetical protein [Patescibacteria group bacterium]